MKQALKFKTQDSIQKTNDLEFGSEEIESKNSKSRRT